MTIALVIVLVLLAGWLAGLTWYVVRLALAPVPVEDIERALKTLAARRAVDLVVERRGQRAVKARLAARQAKP